MRWEAKHDRDAALPSPGDSELRELALPASGPGGAVVRPLGRLAAGGGRRVVVLAPTDAVRDEVTGRFPGLRVRVRPFAVADPGERLTDAERRQARDAFGIPVTEAALCLVGGWWPYKDIAVVDNALAWLDRPLHLLVAGAPLDQEVLDRWAALPAVRLHVVPGPASQEQVRAVYAAADAALVARRPGVGKESGLVVDAVRLGVPLLLSDHDPALPGVPAKHSAVSGAHHPCRLSRPTP